jgi:hypothetical protein
LSNLSQIIQQAQRLLEQSGSDPGVEAERTRLLEALRATQDPSEAARLYDAYISLPAPYKEGNHNVMTRELTVDPEFTRWCENGTLPATIEGLQGVSTIVELYHP